LNEPLGGGRTVEGEPNWRKWGHFFGGSIMCLVHSLVSVISHNSFLAVMRWIALHMSSLQRRPPQAQNNGSRGPLAEPSEAISQNKPFLPQADFLRYLSQWWKINALYPIIKIKNILMQYIYF
jgi:hypothetical protein